jgi:hypothetical protein
LVTSLDEFLAFDAANDALGTARKAASATATAIFVTMVIPPFKVEQDYPVTNLYDIERALIFSNKVLISTNIPPLHQAAGSGR